VTELSKVSKVFFIFFILAFSSAKEWTPVVLWHGISQTCREPVVMRKFIQALEEEMPGVYIKSIKIGSNQAEDLKNSYTDSMNRQVSLVCEEIAKDPKLQNGYNALGYSQGGPLMRGVIQRCPSPPIKLFVSYASPQQGIYGAFETCPDALAQVPKIGTIPCNMIRKTVYPEVYTSVAQQTCMPCQYWHDPLHENDYRKKSAYLADINNERVKNRSYIDNLTKLKMLVLVTHKQDGVVIPRESCSFGFYKPGQDKKVLPMRKTRLYLEDRIGLKKLDKTGRVQEYLQSGEHIQINSTWLKTVLIPQYFKKY